MPSSFRCSSRNGLEVTVDLLPEQERNVSSKEGSIVTYLRKMSRRNDGEYEISDGTPMRIVEAPRQDWLKGELGFRVSRRAE